MSATAADRVTAWQCASLLLDYPGEPAGSGPLAHRELIAAATERLPEPVGAPLAAVLRHLERTAPARLAADYVATFDHRRRCCLYLTYYAYGDTRKRGMALLRLKHAYRAAGYALGADELPDHLAVVLEFAATVDPDAGHRLLVEHRAGLELLRLALREAGSPYVGVLDAVSATLPPPGRADRERVATLVADGPPAEEVGLAPFGPPEYMHGSPSSPVGGPR